MKVQLADTAMVSQPYHPIHYYLFVGSSSVCLSVHLPTLSEVELLNFRLFSACSSLSHTHYPLYLLS